MLSDDDIKLIGQTLGTRIPGASDYSSWPGMGYEKDADGRYTVPCFPAIGYPFARAIESAACAERDARIAELTEKVRILEQAVRYEADLCQQAIDSRKEMEQQLAEARKQMEAQKDEWLSWEAKRRDLEKDAERYRWLCLVPTGFEAQRIVNDTPEGMDAAIDAAIKEQT